MTRIVRVSRALILKGRKGPQHCEMYITNFVADGTDIKIPTIYRVFDIDPNSIWSEYKRLMLMQFIEGPTVERVWETLDEEERRSIVAQVTSSMTALTNLPIPQRPGCPHCNECVCDGPWFGPAGMGPFASAIDLENWFNDVLDIFRILNLVGRQGLPFFFGRLKLTHQNLTPSNLIWGPGGRVWILDWRLAGVYPEGMEVAAMMVQDSLATSFTDRVLERAATNEKTVGDLLSLHRAVQIAKDA